MSVITLNLTDAATEDFATFYGWNPTVVNTDDSENTANTPNPVTAEDFTTTKLLEKITNDLTEKRNRDAIAAVSDVVIADVTTDGSRAA